MYAVNLETKKLSKICLCSVVLPFVWAEMRYFDKIFKLGLLKIANEYREIRSWITFTIYKQC